MGKNILVRRLETVSEKINPVSDVPAKVRIDRGLQGNEKNYQRANEDKSFPRVYF